MLIYFCLVLLLFPIGCHSFDVFDFDMLVHEMDRDPSGFAELLVSYKECIRLDRLFYPFDVAVFPKVTGDITAKDNLPRFSMEIGQSIETLPPGLPPYFPTVINSFHARVNFTSTTFSIEVPTWYLVDTFDLESCNKNVMTNNDYVTVAFSKTLESSSEPKFIWVSSFLRRSDKTDVTYFIRQVAQSKSQLVPPGWFKQTCPRRVDNGKDLPFNNFETVSESSSILFKNYFYEYDDDLGRAVKKPSQAVYFTSASNSPYRTVDSILAESSKMCTSRMRNITCLRYFLYGPEVAMNRRCTSVCRPADPSLRHLPQLCDGGFRETKLGISCNSFSLNGNVMPNAKSRFLLYLPETPEILNLGLLCRVVNDHRSYLLRCNDTGTTAFCDPMLSLVKDNVTIFEAANISTPTSARRSPAIVTLDRFGFDRDISVVWAPESDDIRFFNITFALSGSNIWLKQNLAGTYQFFVKFANESLRVQFGITQIAQVEVVLTSRPPIRPHDSSVTTLIPHYFHLGEHDVYLSCTFSHIAFANRTIWQKSIAGRFVSKAGLLDNENRNLAAEALAFEEATTVLAANWFRLAFQQIVEANAGLYRCANAFEDIWEYHFVNVLKPMSCNVFVDSHTLPLVAPLAGEIFAYGVTFFVQPNCVETAEQITSFDIVCQLGNRYLSICETNAVCDPKFLIFKGKQLLVATSAINNQPSRTLPIPAQAIGLQFNLPVTPYDKYTVVAAFHLSQLENGIFSEDIFETYFPKFVLQSAHDGKGTCAYKRRDARYYDRCDIVISGAATFSRVNAKLTVAAATPVNVTFVCDLSRASPIVLCDESKLCDPSFHLVIVNSNSESDVAVIYCSANGSLFGDDSPFFRFINIFVTPSSPREKRVNVTMAFFQNPLYYKEALNLDSSVIRELSRNYSVRFYNDDHPGEQRNLVSKIAQVFVDIQQPRTDAFERNCKRDSEGYTYAGSLAQTICGDPCTLWVPYMFSLYQIPAEYPELFPRAIHNHTFSADFRQCRNLEMRSPSLYCPLKSESVGDKLWGYCHVPPCDDVEDKRVLTQFTRKFGSCDCLVLTDYTTVHVEPNWEEDARVKFFRCSWVPPECPLVTKYIPNYSEFYHRMANRSVLACAEACAKDSNCKSFTYENNNHCVLRKCTCSDVPCDNRRYIMYYEKKNPLPPPAEWITNDITPGTESMWVHDFEEGARAITIECKQLRYLWSNVIFHVLWEIFDPVLDDFKALDPVRWSPSTETFRGVYLTFNGVSLTTRDSGIYRCLFNGTSEYHQVKVYKRIRCRGYVNETWHAETEGFYDIDVWTQSTETLVLDVACKTDRPIELKPNSDNVVNPVVTFMVNNVQVSELTQQVLLLQVVQWRPNIVRARMVVSNTSSFRKFSFSFKFLPIPVRNNLNNLMVLAPLWLNLLPAVTRFDLVDKFQPMFESSILVKPWRYLEDYYTLSPIGENGNIPKSSYHMEVYLDAITTGLEINLRLHLALRYEQYGKFCDNPIASCIPTVITVTKKAGSPDETQERLPIGYRTDLKYNEPQFFSTLKDGIELNVAFHPVEVVPVFEHDFHQLKKMAGIYIIQVQVGDEYLGNLHQIKAIFDVKVAPTIYGGVHSIDCFRWTGGSDYIGIKSKSACRNRKCVDWSKAQKTLGQSFPSTNLMSNSSNYCRGVMSVPSCFVPADDSSSSTLLSDFCDVPFCYDFSAGTNYERTAGDCAYCSASAKIEGNYETKVKTSSACQFECDQAGRNCSGFFFDVTQKRCSLYQAPCNCTREQVAGQCGSSSGFYFRKLMLTDTVFEPPNVRLVLHFHQVESETPNVEFFLSSQPLDVQSFLFYAAKKWNNKALPSDVSTAVSVFSGQQVLKLGSSASKGKHEGIYEVKTASSHHFSFVRVNEKPACVGTLDIWNENTVPFPFGYEIKLNDLGHDLIRANWVRVSCANVQHGAYGWCYGGGDCSPRVRVYYASNGTVIYSNWHTDAVARAPLTVSTIGYFSMTFTLLDNVTVNFVDLNLVIHSRFYPTTQPWPVWPFTIADDQIIDPPFAVDRDRPSRLDFYATSGKDNLLAAGRLAVFLAVWCCFLIAA